VAIDNARQWYLGCLSRYDTPELPFNFDGVQRDLAAYAAEVCQESLARVRADLALIEQTGAPGDDAPPPDPWLARSPATRPSDTPPLHVVDTSDRNAGDAAEDAIPDAGEAEPEILTTEISDHDTTSRKSRPPITETRSLPSAELPQDVKSLRARLWTLATQLAQSHGFAECIRLCKQGCGFTVDLPEGPLFEKGYPSTAMEAERLMLWWMLSALADQWPYGPDDTPSLSALEEARIGPVLLAAASEDQSALAGMLEPRVGFPPSLDLAARQLFAVLSDRDYARLLDVMEARRLLQRHCKRLGKANVWLL
jgi:hypothetical protein